MEFIVGAIEFQHRAVGELESDKIFGPPRDRNAEHVLEKRDRFMQPVGADADKVHFTDCHCSPRNCAISALPASRPSFGRSWSFPRTRESKAAPPAARRHWTPTFAISCVTFPAGRPWPDRRPRRRRSRGRCRSSLAPHRLGEFRIVLFQHEFHLRLRLVDPAEANEINGDIQAERRRSCTPASRQRSNPHFSQGREEPTPFVVQTLDAVRVALGGKLDPLQRLVRFAGNDRHPARSAIAASVVWRE